MIVIEIPHDASQIPCGRAKTQRIVMAHQTIGEDLNSPKRMSLVQHLQAGIESVSPEGRLARQTTVHHMIDYTRIFKAQMSSLTTNLTLANETLKKRFGPIPPRMGQSTAPNSLPVEQGKTWP